MSTKKLNDVARGATLAMLADLWREKPSVLRSKPALSFVCNRHVAARSDCHAHAALAVPKKNGNQDDTGRWADVRFIYASGAAWSASPKSWGVLANSQYNETGRNCRPRYRLMQARQLADNVDTCCFFMSDDAVRNLLSQCCNTSRCVRFLSTTRVLPPT